MPAPRSTPRLASELAHPLPLLAVLVLLVNDHVLKSASALPGWLTGKLSDVAGLFFFPVLLFVLIDGLARIGRCTLGRAPAAVACALATGLVFGGVKLHPGWNAWACAHWGPVALDPSDLLTLPMVAAGAWWVVGRDWSARAHEPLLRLRFAIVFVSCLASIATPPPRQTRNYPAWDMPDLGVRYVGCASADAWVSKSGKQGVGVTLQVRARTEAPCELRVQRAQIEIAGRAIEALRLPDAVRVGRRPAYLYLAFAFDNEQAWNAEQLAAVWSVDVWANGETARLRRPMAHRWPGPHRMLTEAEWLPPPPEEDAGIEPPPCPPAEAE